MAQRGRDELLSISEEFIAAPDQAFISARANSKSAMVMRTSSGKSSKSMTPINILRHSKENKWA